MTDINAEIKRIIIKNGENANEKLMKSQIQEEKKNQIKIINFYFKR